jgi:NAD(P)-dependent dehydrogenase (short-subunit alcohol dehydrogenase family)
MPAEIDLTGRVALVTGALGNLGPVWASALADAGALVHGIDVRGGSFHGGGDLHVADVTDRDSLAGVLDAIGGAPDVLVNNAGIDQPPDAGAATRRIEEIPLDEFARVLQVNLTGTFAATQVFGAAMAAARRGSIVNIGSLYAGIAPDPSFYSHLSADPPFLKPPAYGASKAGVVQLTRYFARLWGPAGVRVNALSPGGVLGGQDPEFLEKYGARTPLRRMADPGDLRGPLLFLASDMSSYMTGHELRVDGGFTA